CERAHAGFVHARDMHEALLPQLLLVTAQVAQALAFGARGVPPAFDGLENRAGARTLVGAQRGFERLRQRAFLLDVALAQLGERMRAGLGHGAESIATGVGRRIRIARLAAFPHHCTPRASMRARSLAARAATLPCAALSALGHTS